MPIAEYRCAAGHRFEEVFLAGETMEQRARCSCGEPANRIVSSFRVVGPVFEHLEDFERRLLSPKDRAAGARFTSGKDIQAWEEAHNLRPLTESEARSAMSDAADDANTIQRVYREDGQEAALDHVDTCEVLENTRIEPATYRRIKEMERAIADSPTPDPDAAQPQPHG